MVSEQPFGVIMKTIRINHGLDQKTMAKKIGITQSTLSKYENLEMKPDITVWFDFCFTYDLVPDCFTENGFVEKVDVEENRLLELCRSKKYFDAEITNISLIIPIISYVDKQHQTKVKNFYKEIGIKPEFFRVRQNLVPLRFLYFFLNQASALFSSGDNDFFIKQIFENFCPLCLGRQFIDKNEGLEQFKVDFLLSLPMQQKNIIKDVVLNEKEIEVSLSSHMINAANDSDNLWPQYLNHFLQFVVSKSLRREPTQFHTKQNFPKLIIN